jgi:DNA-binding transcriptional regulator LsrR (DeoR family)
MAEPESDEKRARAALRAAQMYYMQDLTMEAIARDLAMSRSSVSRLLAYARETGLVEITVSSPLAHGAGLERKILERFGVTAHVVPMPPGVTDIDRLDRVAMTGARMLSSWMDSNMTLGIAWGSTISALSRHLVRKETHNSTIVQMNGAGNTRTTGIDYASEIMQRFGAAFSAQIQQLAVPAIFDDPAVKLGLWKERSVHRVLEIQARMDIALFGLGSPFAEIPSHVYIGGYLDAADYKSLSEQRVVGDLATVFFRRDGSSHDVALNKRASGPDLHRLRRVPRRVCIVSGVQKLASLQGALAAGLVTDLVIDESLATRLLETP